VNRILDAIPYGEHEAITYAELAARTGLPRRACEKAVEGLRAAGAPICTGNAGLWRTQDADELLEHYRRLRSRALHQLPNLRAMQRTAERLRTPLTLWTDAA
jgi:hypothetical protein